MAIECNCYENIGYDLVAICVNDVLESGTEPVAFLDYIACGKLQVPVAAQIIKGISEACRESNCALLGNYSLIYLNYFSFQCPKDTYLVAFRFIDHVPIQMWCHFSP